MRITPVLFLLYFVLFPSTVSARQVTPTVAYIYSVFSRLASNDTFMLPAGTYYLSSRAQLSDLVNVAVISRDGPGKAVIIGTTPASNAESIVFEKCSTVSIIGIEIRQSGDNILKFGGCTNVLVKDCYIHNASNQGDCIKATQHGADNTMTSNITIQGCIIHSPGHTSSTEFEECFDMMYTRNALITDCWFFLTDTGGNQLSYPKGGCEDIIYERCLFGPQSTIAWDPAVGGGVASVTSGFNVERETIRSCVFFDCHSGAVGSFGSKDFWIYNNTFINCAHRTDRSPQYLGIIHVKHGGGAAANSENFYIYNNAFYNNQQKNVYIFCTQGVTALNVNHDYNAYYNTGSILTTVDYNPATEGNRVTANPYAAGAPDIPALPNVTISSHTWAQLDSLKKLIIRQCRTAAGASVIDHGTAANATPYPDVTADIEGLSSPYNNVYDIGAYEYDPSVTVEQNPPAAQTPGIAVWPNPFNPVVTIAVNGQRPTGKGTTLCSLYDARGKLVKKVFAIRAGSGAYLTWDATGMASGVYTIRTVIDNMSYSKRIILTR
ncbi:MAG: hypothetical protein A2268_13780 [Candidatus Raymondbacteria bacterium RifOxyA12_full_50_37]|uniref:Uncharacterized protein n=1 Tax=Candidatus Raymondbacteria bacterium RIFOXYD12_FULL_49_13 TaxID=1817890 RepID=A0A1F7FM37_UNCRA|nr:MAG: hypothetical protein A2248_08065 [Candidatus Raymondbacteria bacterium RIFOXYA2_FULL_49_16]OGJ91679.1 MAG: hypothetical protein A2268_13780 [Candidatus Raymondbacteria bacterium RifOxyA12_full_50_37]OGJ95210.1 MAG: hypothetical protein A2453_12075 [Candidatus Raymondbacteria bacterium RIFOXYC2_FULL_50_21]OGJ99065.1 MAG: hypothetical protein A2487_03470 [Candidatus Raymondbacteria bacterium RifOxyC12_full_50_8]OGK07566.1 MAG: hypothetical protein A2519_01575 [Candidatus Raymondbacteria b